MLRHETPQNLNLAENLGIVNLINEEQKWMTNGYEKLKKRDRLTKNLKKYVNQAITKRLMVMRKQMRITKQRCHSHTMGDHNGNLQVNTCNSVLNLFENLGKIQLENEVTVK